MAVSRVKNGSKLQGILETGKIIVKTALEYNFTKMEINTRVCGVEILDTDKALIGEMKVVNWEESILVIGSKIKNMAEEHSFIRTETDMMVIGSTECPKEKVEWFTQMKTFMKANGMKEKEMDMEYWLKEMVIILKAIG